MHYVYLTFDKGEKSDIIAIMLAGLLVVCPVRQGKKPDFQGIGSI